MTTTYVPLKYAKKAMREVREESLREGERRGYARATEFVRMASSLNGSTHAVLKALQEEGDGLATPRNRMVPVDGDGAAVDGAPDGDLDAVLMAALDALAEAKTHHPETDGGPVYAYLAGLLADPEALADALAEMDGGEVVGKSFDESKHPRGDNGRFIGREQIHAAKSDPKLADELRAKTTDPEQRKKLEAALSGEVDTGRTKAGAHREQVAKRKQDRQERVKRAQELANEISMWRRGGEAVPSSHFRELADVLPSMTVNELRSVRGKLAASFGGDRRKSEMAARLLEHAKNKAALLETNERYDDMDSLDFGSLHEYQSLGNAKGNERENPNPEAEHGGRMAQRHTLMAEHPDTDKTSHGTPDTGSVLKIPDERPEPTQPETRVRHIAAQNAKPTYTTEAGPEATVEPSATEHKFAKRIANTGGLRLSPEEVASFTSRMTGDEANDYPIYQQAMALHDRKGREAQKAKQEEFQQAKQSRANEKAASTRTANKDAASAVESAAGAMAAHKLTAQKMSDGSYAIGGEGTRPLSPLLRQYGKFDPRTNRWVVPRGKMQKLSAALNDAGKVEAAKRERSKADADAALRRAAEVHVNTPRDHNDLIGKYGGKRREVGGQWTTVFPDQASHDAYQREVKKLADADAAKRKADWDAGEPARRAASEKQEAERQARIAEHTAGLHRKVTEAGHTVRGDGKPQRHKKRWWSERDRKPHPPVGTIVQMDDGPHMVVSGGQHSISAKQASESEDFGSAEQQGHYTTWTTVPIVDQQSAASHTPVSSATIPPDHAAALSSAAKHHTTDKPEGGATVKQPSEEAKKRLDALLAPGNDVDKAREAAKLAEDSFEFMHHIGHFTDGTHDVAITGRGATQSQRDATRQRIAGPFKTEEEARRAFVEARSAAKKPHLDKMRAFEAEREALLKAEADAEDVARPPITFAKPPTQSDVVQGNADVASEKHNQSHNSAESEPVYTSPDPEHVADIARARDADKKFRGEGRYEAEVWQKLRNSNPDKPMPPLSRDAAEWLADGYERDGKPIPDEVLKDNPDLRGQYQKTAAPAASDTPMSPAVHDAVKDAVKHHKRMQMPGKPVPQMVVYHIPEHRNTGGQLIEPAKVNAVPVNSYTGEQLLSGKLPHLKIEGTFEVGADGTPKRVEGADFTKSINDAITSTPSTHGDARFIHHVYDAMRQKNPSLTRDEFNRQLIDAHKRRDITLSRLDMPQGHATADIQAARVPHMNAEFHFVEPNGKRATQTKAIPSDWDDLRAELAVKRGIVHDDGATGV